MHGRTIQLCLCSCLRSIILAAVKVWCEQLLLLWIFMEVGQQDQQEHQKRYQKEANNIKIKPKGQPKRQPKQVFQFSKLQLGCSFGRNGTLCLEPPSTGFLPISRLATESPKDLMNLSLRNPAFPCKAKKFTVCYKKPYVITPYWPIPYPGGYPN